MVRATPHSIQFGIMAAVARRVARRALWVPPEHTHTQTTVWASAFFYSIDKISKKKNCLALLSCISSIAHTHTHTRARIAQRYFVFIAVWYSFRADICNVCCFNFFFFFSLSSFCVLWTPLVVVVLALLVLLLFGRTTLTYNCKASAAALDFCFEYQFFFLSCCCCCCCLFRWSWFHIADRFGAQLEELTNGAGKEICWRTIFCCCCCLLLILLTAVLLLLLAW